MFATCKEVKIRQNPKIGIFKDFIAFMSRVRHTRAFGRFWEQREQLKPKIEAFDVVRRKMIDVMRFDVGGGSRGVEPRLTRNDGKATVMQEAEGGDFNNVVGGEGWSERFWQL
ncbi:hypothetical protein L1987_06779 [Smallanthus sonchifolius]|uniref:Uncharacterized protein n=1 Tax=Smallanthus sonchifolius TaxID=185202 RepID=A0ACB9JZ38_9ASTR|nr:hypothetical protein L1987_06779 [Smallanthus sonchifolius]